VRWNPLSIANEIFLKFYQSNSSSYTLLLVTVLALSTSFVHVSIVCVLII
jgi:hypothetical protein